MVKAWVQLAGLDLDPSLQIAASHLTAVSPSVESGKLVHTKKTTPGSQGLCHPASELVHILLCFADSFLEAMEGFFFF